jgi:hypothetical protein
MGKLLQRVTVTKSPEPLYHPTHAGVAVAGLATKEQACTPQILRDTNGNPLWDTGYSILTADLLSNGIKVTVHNPQ